MNRILSLILLLPLLACSRYVVHPGSINMFDSLTADTLVSAKSLIETSQAELANGTLKSSMRPLIDSLISAYDQAGPIYKMWHEEAKAGTSTDKTAGDLAKLKAALDALNGTITAVKGAR